MFIEKIDFVTEEIRFIDEIECDICKKRINYNKYKKSIDDIKKEIISKENNPMFEIKIYNKEKLFFIDYHFCCKECYKKFLLKILKEL